MFQTVVLKNEFIQLYEPPVDVLVNADIIIEAEYEIQDSVIFEHMGRTVPENIIFDTVKLGVLKAVNSAFPTGLSMAQLKNPPAEFGDAALVNVKNKLLRFFGIAFTSIVVKEINPEIPSFVASVLSMQKPVSITEDKDWICPECSNNNSGKFCTECGTKKP